MLYHQKAYTVALFEEIYIIDCHGMLPICIFSMFWGADEVKNEKWNTYDNIYTPNKSSRLVYMKIIIINMFQKIVYVYSL